MSIARVVNPIGTLVLIAAACGTLPSAGTADAGLGASDVDAIVQATFQAMTATAGDEAIASAAPVATGSETGSVSGSLSYPAEHVPAMYITAFEVGTESFKYVATGEGERNYRIDGLSPGTYQVVAYTVGGAGLPAGIAGGYTQAVICGLRVECSDHTLISIPVEAGQAISGIDPADWYLVEAAFPPFPGISSPVAAAGTGSITGTLMYPSSGIPSLRVVAFQADGSAYYYVDTVAGQSTYTIDNLPPGPYRVVAYVASGGGLESGPAGGYSQMVPCGLKYGCNDHTLIDVLVTAGNTTGGIDPNDYYADPGVFPTNPAP